MTRDDDRRPETQVRIRVTQRPTPSTASADGGWTPFAGEVVAADPQSPVAAGQRVAGFGPPGAEIEVPAWAVAAVPAELAAETAALLPVAAVAARAARLVGGRAGDAAQVIGNGILAELVGEALRAAGLARVTVASAPGADLPHVVVDTTGDPAVISTLLEGTPRLGCVALVGASRGRTVDVDFYRTVHQRGLEVVGVHDFGPFSPIAVGEERIRDLAAAAVLVRSAPRNDG